MPFFRMRKPRIAVVHDWIVTWNGGSERVLHQILKVFPDADVFAVVEHLPAEHRRFLERHKVATTFLQNVPGSSRRYRYLLPLMPIAIESLDLSGYDLVLSSSHAVAKGVITGPGQLHICYCHSPMRYAWDLQHQYFEESGLNRGLRKWLAMAMLHYMRGWDLRTVPGVDFFIANSRFVARRIQKVYGRSSTVIHPPVDVENFRVENARGDYYVVVSRLVPYKKLGLLLDAFKLLPGRRLVVIGGGPQKDRLAQAAPPNVELLGEQPFESMRQYLQGARAFMYAAEEDFGMSIVEAQACGTPVIAYGSGGALETVLPGATGLFFETQTAESVAGAVGTFESCDVTLTAAGIRNHSLNFSSTRFRSAYQSFVLDCCRSQTFNTLLRDWAESYATEEPLAVGAR